MILDRFDAVIFIGDDLVRNIYAAFNALLRENVALGGLRQWDMDQTERNACRCENQFIRSECTKFTVMANQDVRENDAKGGHPSPYLCDRKAPCTVDASLGKIPPLLDCSSINPYMDFW